jgi:hypothetical protein
MRHVRLHQGRSLAWIRNPAERLRGGAALSDRNRKCHKQEADFLGFGGEHAPPAVQPGVQPGQQTQRAPQPAVASVDDAAEFFSASAEPPQAASSARGPAAARRPSTAGAVPPTVDPDSLADAFAAPATADPDSLGDIFAAPARPPTRPQGGARPQPAPVRPAPAARPRPSSTNGGLMGGMAPAGPPTSSATSRTSDQVSTRRLGLVRLQDHVAF